MDIISLLITIIGILIILGLYILGRISRSKMPKEKSIGSVPKIVDENGDRFTSVLEDIPARDGSTPKPFQADINPETSTPESSLTTATTAANASSEPSQAVKQTATSPAKKESKKKAQVAQTQHVLFVSGNDEQGLDGNLIDSVLNKHGLHFGDMDIYHYLLDQDGNASASLFRIANGVKPWTLTENDIKDKYLPGLSLLLVTPSPIDDRQAIETFVATAKLIAKGLNGKLKNQSQELFSEKDKNDFLEKV